VSSVPFESIEEVPLFDMFSRGVIALEEWSYSLWTLWRCRIGLSVPLFDC
jgi:hypothetical protein